MGVAENNITNQVLLALPGHVRLFRNNVGLGFIGKPIVRGRSVIINDFRRIAFGLHKGSGDFIGWQTVKITPDMVGQEFAQFVSVEMKTKTGAVKKEQSHWRDVVTKCGGIACIVRCVDDIRGVFTKQD